MSELLDCSVSTIWSVESGRMKLSDSIADRMAFATDVNLAWLVDGDPAKAPTTKAGEPFTKEAFERYAAERRAIEAAAQSNEDFRFVQFAGRLKAILDIAGDKKSVDLALYKAEKAIDALAKEFGENGAESVEASAARLGDALQRFKDSVKFTKASAKKASGKEMGRPAAKSARRSPRG